MRLSNVLAGLAVSALLFCSTVAARAEAYLFSVQLNGGPDFSFTLDKSPTPDEFFSGGSFGIYNLATTIGTFSQISFYAPGIGNGFVIMDDTVPLIDTSSVLPMYQGSEDAPTFLVGNYVLLNFFGDAEVGSMTISAAVPEPSTWAMMLLGFAGVGFMAYRRRGQIARLA